MATPLKGSDSQNHLPIETDKSQYNLYGRKYYYTHQEQINEYRSASGVGRRGSEKYYKANAETIRLKNLAHYHKKKAELIEFLSLAKLSELS
jgi:hypothetical protein